MQDATPRVEPTGLPERWPTERPLLVLVVIAAIALWIAIGVSLIGAVYAVMLGVFFFLGHLLFIAHLRGNGVRLGPDQFPELHTRVEALAGRLGMPRTPAAYVIQAGGALNALATKFLGSQFIVLYSDLLDACGENTDARDFIIAHELGHLHAGHLRWRWLLLPGLLMPFLGTAYSRACEYTCDRYGMAGTHDPERGLDGLCILAAGGRHGPKVNRRALVAQGPDLDTFWMTIGRWLSTHPPVAARLGELQPALAEGVARRRGPAVAAGAAVTLCIVLPVAAAASFVRSWWPRFQEQIAQQQRVAMARANPAGGRAEAEAAIRSLAGAIEHHLTTTGDLPVDTDHLYEVWADLHPGAEEPIDPFDGERLGYRAGDGRHVLWSIGADAADDGDDIKYRSETVEKK